ncbi:MAG: thiol-disulfide oxidoreductase DCC family protein [Haloarculaceae archaeon]
MTDTPRRVDVAPSSDRDPAAVVEDIERPVLLFDGVCNLCHAGIRAIVRLDAGGDILFAPLQSAVGQELLEQHGLSADYFDSVVLVEDGKAYTKSTAALRVCRHLDGPVPLLYPLVYLPERLRDAVYDVVADYRYQVFGKKDECPVPEEHIRERFLERSLA